MRRSRHTVYTEKTLGTWAIIYASAVKTSGRVSSFQQFCQRIYRFSNTFCKLAKNSKVWTMNPISGAIIANIAELVAIDDFTTLSKVFGKMLTTIFSGLSLHLLKLTTKLHVAL